MRDPALMLRLSLLLLVACSNPGPKTASAAETAIVHQYCSRAFECMDDWEPNEHLQDFRDAFTNSEPECEAKYLMRVGDLATLDAAVVAGRVAYDDETMEDCLDDNAAQSCFEWFDYPANADVPHCDGAFVGKVALGEACQLSLECVAGFCEGVCKVFP